MMRTSLLCLLILAALSPGLLAQDFEWPTEGQAYQRFQVDLDGDGSLETVALVAYRVEEASYFGQLMVNRADGQVLWAGPKPADPGDPLAFGAWDWGVAGLEVVGDLDRDGRIEVLGALPQSDVRPATFRVLRWNGSAFRKAFSRCLVESPANSGRYQWTRPSDQYQGLRWIGSFQSTARDGTCVAQVYDTRNSGCRLGMALVAPDAQGFHVVRWIEPPR
jgi:hypothetical protein